MTDLKVDVTNLKKNYGSNQVLNMAKIGSN